jgi:phenylpropionate dioxygenase-like ring-hydroxylating dioxygenase large terminal subunit
MKLETQRELLARVERHLAQKSTDMAPAAARVDAAHYADAALQDVEIRRLFRASPVLVGLTPDAPRPGSFFTEDVAGLPLLVVRGDDGRVRTFVNACRHRGARIADGRGEARSFSCPFHAWHYARDGRLIARANSCGGFDAMPEDDAALRELPCREVAGMIFALPEGHDIDDALERLIGGAREEIASYGIEEHVHFDSRTTERRCNYKLVVDTFCEAYHIAALHKQSILPYYYSVPALSDSMGAVVRMIGVRSSIAKEWPKPVGDRRFVRHGTIQYIVPPNVVLTHQVDHVQLWQVYPVPGAPDRCRVNFRLYWPAPLDDEARRKSAFNVDVIWNVTNDEDFPQCEQAQAAMASGAIERLVFGRNEPALVHYHGYMDAAIGAGLVARGFGS